MTGSQSDWGERSLQRGGYRRQGDTGRAEQLERPVSARRCKHRNKAGRIAGSTGKAIEAERESDRLGARGGGESEAAQSAEESALIRALSLAFRDFAEPT
jgi:hypothetical protein